MMFRTFVFTLVGVGIALGAHAQTRGGNVAASPTTRLLPFSGVAVDASGEPMKGAATVTFELYEEQEGGAPLWRETQRIAGDAQGRYVAYLGSTVALPQIAFTEERARWIAVTVQGRVQPRVMLLAVPYALRAADAETLGGQPAADYVRARPDGLLETSAGLIDRTAVDGSGVAGQLAKFSSSATLSSSVITESVSNRIGVGLPDPTGAGVVDSVFTIRNFDNNTGFAVLNQSQARRFALNTLATGAWTLYDGGNGTWNQGVTQTVGSVGIGTTAPIYRLDVRAAGTGGGILGTATAAGARAIEGDAGVNGVGVIGFANGASGWAVAGIHPTGGTAGFFDGRVGIGTSLPADTLQVLGDIRVGTGTVGCVKDADGELIAGVCSSDLRFKKNVRPFSATLDKVSQLQAVYFDWRADEFPNRKFGASRSFGLVAQDVEAVLPELVVTDDEGYKAVKYNQLPLHMLQAIKELKAENDALKQQLAGQEERLRRLEALAGK